MVLFKKTPYQKSVDAISPIARRHPVKKVNRSAIQLLLMVSLGVIFIAIFAYIPMFGLILAFKQDGYHSSILVNTLFAPYVGFDNFKEFLNDPDFINVLLNTLGLNILQLLINFPLPILFAVLLSELPWKKIRKGVQVVTYFPYFLSWVTYGGIILVMLNSDGLINNLLMALKVIDAPVEFGASEWFWPTIIISSLLKGMGWGSVIYVAAIAGIDPQLYEAADMDGATRWHRIFHITIPSIAPTIVLFFILSVSGILNSGFDHIYTFQNAINLERSEVLDTFIFKYGTINNRFAYTTAVGFFKSIVAIILLSVGNFVAKKTTGSGVI